MELTKADIEKDIVAFEQRIMVAQSRLTDLPTGYLPFKQHKKWERAKQQLLDEIVHVRRLIAIAEEGILIRAKVKMIF